MTRLTDLALAAVEARKQAQETPESTCAQLNALWVISAYHKAATPEVWLALRNEVLEEVKRSVAEKLRGWGDIQQAVFDAIEALKTKET